MCRDRPPRALIHICSVGWRADVPTRKTPPSACRPALSSLRCSVAGCRHRGRAVCAHRAGARAGWHVGVRRGANFGAQTSTWREHARMHARVATMIRFRAVIHNFAPHSSHRIPWAATVCQYLRPQQDGAVRRSNRHSTGHAPVSGWRRLWHTAGPRGLSRGGQPRVCVTAMLLQADVWRIHSLLRGSCPCAR